MAATSCGVGGQFALSVAGRRHPWLDVLVETPTHLIGVESKRFEPYRSRHVPSFSPAFDRQVWKTGMQPYLTMLAALKSKATDLWALDAAQLIKHALALSTQAEKLGKRAALLYLYADPDAWLDGRAIPAGTRSEHALHLKAFAEATTEADVRFAAATYAQLFQIWVEGEHDVQNHARAVMTHFQMG